MTYDNQLIGADLGVRRLIAQYAAHVDSRRLDEAVALFAPDASVVVNGETHEGRDAVRGWFEGLFQTPPGMHLTTNTVVDIDPAQPDRATAWSEVAYIRKLENGWSVMVAGRYEDVCQLSEGGWLFTNRTIEIG